MMNVTTSIIDYEYIEVKNYEIKYSELIHKYTFDFGEFDVVNVMYGSNSMWYSSDFGFYEGNSPVTGKADLLLMSKGNNKKILNDSNSDHIPDALGEADVDILEIHDRSLVLSGAIDWTPTVSGIPYMNILNDSGVAKIVNTTFYARRHIEGDLWEYPNLNGNVSVYIYRDAIDIGLTTPPDWVLVAKAENIPGTWWTIQGPYGACNVTNIPLTPTFAGEPDLTWVKDEYYRVVVLVEGDYKGDTVVEFDSGDINFFSESNNRLCFWGFS